MNNLFDLRGERILVTGAGGSIGGATARVCAALGAELFIADLKAPTELGSELKARAAALDNTRRDDVEALVKDIGHLDALIDASGYYVKGDWLDGGDEWDELFARTMAINVRGPMNLVRAVLPQMRARGAGVVVNVTSSVTYKPLPLVGVYRAAKAAVNAFTESLASEVEPFGVRVRLVLPGSSGETRFRDTARTRLRGMDDAVYGEFMRQTIARMAESTGPGTRMQDVAEAVWRAATDPSAPLRLPAGADAVQWAAEAG